MEKEKLLLWQQQDSSRSLGLQTISLERYQGYFSVVAFFYGQIFCIILAKNDYSYFSLYFQIWEMSDPTGKGFLDKGGLFIACKMVALVQCDIPLTIDNARIDCKAPNFGAETAPGAPTAAGGAQPGAKLPVKMAINFLVKPEEKRKYDALFDQLQPEDDKISGDKVCSFINMDTDTDLQGLI